MNSYIAMHFVFCDKLRESIIASCLISPNAGKLRPINGNQAKKAPEIKVK